MTEKNLSPGQAAMARLDTLATFTDEPGRLTRHYLGAAHRAAAAQILDWMEKASMTTRIDAVGTIIGRYEGANENAPALILGSHIDTVTNAGKYDGNLGVVAAIACIEELARTGIRFPFAIEVAAFGDEEGVRFPDTLTGSRALAGTLPPNAFDLKDADGISLRQALLDFGCAPIDLPAMARRPQDVLGFVELHIEQGPVLEKEDLPVGIVTAINGASRYSVELTGLAGHAGTVPMDLRRDALAGAAEMITTIEQIAVQTDDLVATVGTIDVAPCARNVIPGSASFSIDIRSSSDDIRKETFASIEAALRAIAKRRQLDMATEQIYDAAAVACSPDMMDLFEAAITKAGIRPYRLPSGAGHDGLAMAALCPIAMLFVRCEGGLSHHPDELVAPEDAEISINVLRDFMIGFATGKSGSV